MKDNSRNNKRIVKNTVLLYFRSVLLLGMNLYMSRIALQALGISDYGIYQIVGGVVSMFSILSSNMTSASQRFITYALGEGDSQKLKDVFSTCITLHIVMGLIVVFLLEIVGIWFLNSQLNIPVERLPVAVWVMHFSIATFFVNVVVVPFNATIIAHERMGTFAYISLSEGVLRLACVILLVFLPWDNLFLYASLFLCVSLIVLTIYYFYCSHYFEEARQIKLYINKPLFKSMFSFAGWNLIGSGSMVLRNQGIDILLNLFFGVTINAAKGISNQVQNAIHQLVGNFLVSANPQLTMAIAQRDYNRAHNLVYYGCKMAFFLMMLMAVPIIVCCHDLLSIWLVEIPPLSVEMVQLSLIYLLSDAMSRLLINSLLAQGDIKVYQLTMGGLKMFALPLAYVILKIGGSPLTGIIVNIFLDFVCLGGRLYFNKQKLQFAVAPFIYGVVIRCWAIFALSLIISILFHDYVSQNVLLACMLAIITSVMTIWLLGMDGKERKLTIGYIAKVIQRR